MGQCLITKLKGVVDNNSLPKLGELIVNVDNADEVTLELSVPYSSINYRTFGNVTMKKVNDTTYSISGTGKLFLSGTGNEKLITWRAPSLSFPNLSCEFTKDIIALNISNKGEDTPILKCKSKAILSNTNIVGKFSSIPNVMELDFNACTFNNSESLDLSKLANSINLSNLIKFSCTGSKITGDISVLGANNATNIANPMFLWGNQDKIGTWGDASKLLKNGGTVMLTKSEKGYTWSNRPSDYKILSIFGNFKNDGDIDKMLINQAQLNAGATYTYKAISVEGTRTSASDSAIATLQEKGFTVSVAPAS